MPHDALAHISVTQRDRPVMDTPLLRPRGPVEEFLADCWCKVLAIREVGVEDNFFLLGGDSLHMVQIVARVQEQWKIELPVGAFFDSPTIAAHAKLIEADLPG